MRPAERGQEQWANRSFGSQEKETESIDDDVRETNFELQTFVAKVVEELKILKEKYPKTPVVAITGWGPQPQALAVEAHADHVLEKPFDIRELERLVIGLISERVTTKQ